MAVQGNILSEKVISVTYFDPKRNSDLLKYAQDMRSAGEFTDFTFKVKDQVFPVHKLVMGSVSDYFKSLFKFRGKDVDFLELKDVDVDHFQPILDFCYSGEIQVNPGNVQDILMAAHYFDVGYLKQVCQKYIEVHLDDGNVLAALKFATDFSLNDLKSSSLQYFQKHMLSVIREPSFLDLEPKMLRDILDEDELGVGRSFSEGEEIVLMTVLMYLSRKPASDELTHSLMPVVRFPEINQARVQGIVAKFPSLMDNELVKHYTSLGSKVRTMVKEDSDMDDEFPEKWVMPRNTTHVQFCKVDKRYAVPDDEEDFPYPRGFDQVSPEMEIDSISICVRPGNEDDVPDIISGLAVRYRPISMCQPDAKKTATMDVDEDDDDNVQVSGQFRPGWIHELVQLLPGEYIIGVQIDADDCFVYGIEFYTSNERQIGYRGELIGPVNVEIAENEKCGRLAAICCDDEVFGKDKKDRVIYNLVLRWIRCVH